MLAAPCFVVGMETGRRKDWREEETIDQAVRRLIGVMDERKKKASEGLDTSEKFADQPAVSLAQAEKEGPSWSDQGDSTLDSSAPITGAGGVYAGFDSGCGQVVVHRKSRPCEDVQGVTIACPLTEADTIAGGFTVPYANGNAPRREIK
jgi:hypothetical protein